MVLDICNACLPAARAKRSDRKSSVRKTTTIFTGQAARGTGTFCTGSGFHVALWPLARLHDCITHRVILSINLKIHKMRAISIKTYQPCIGSQFRKGIKLSLFRLHVNVSRFDFLLLEQMRHFMVHFSHQGTFTVVNLSDFSPTLLASSEAPVSIVV